MSALTIHGVTVSVDFGDKEYGRGNGRFMSASSKVPDDHPGIPLTALDDVVRDGADLYFTAWQTLMQTRYATGEIGGETYKRETAAFIVRMQRIRELFAKIRGKSTEELETFLKTLETKNVTTD